MENKNELLRRKRKQLEAMGGENAVKKQHDSQKLTARERIELLLDRGSFIELDAHVKHRSNNFGLDKKEIFADAVICGIGKINGRTIAVYSQDFTSSGGSLGEMHAKKIVKVMELALSAKVPVIAINDSGGARIQEGINALAGYGEIFYRNTLSSGVIPQISVILGPCAGGAVYSPALTDFVFMVENISKMFITGPEVIKTVLGEEIEMEALGGAMVHNEVSGNAHFYAHSEEECFKQIKKLLSFLPAHSGEPPPEAETSSPPESDINEIVPADPKKPYDIKDVISSIVDAGDFFEVQKYFAPNVVVGFIRICGLTAGIVANQPKVLAGVLDVDSSDKASRFVRFCDAFNIPLVTFVDIPGYLPGIDQEHSGVIRHGAKLLYAYSEATVPKITCILRKAYGGGYIAMCSKHLGADFVFAWPVAEIAVMGSHGAASIIFKKEIEIAPEPEEFRKEKIEEYKEKFASPYIAASFGYIDDVVHPEETRSKIAVSLATLKNKSAKKPERKHGNIPL